ncbi:MAG: TVP38/TMEM64 family protein [Alphaproteobacteria bacterium]|nr:TVP38/TMEM64 family protein [Alphaproteobacteria bacterium]
MTQLVKTIETPTQPQRRRASELARRGLPLAVMAAAIGAFFGLGLDQYVTFDALREHRELLTGFVSDHAIAAVAVFVVLYAVATALSLPGGAVLSVTGGFLFGSVLGTAWIVIAATLGATALFLVAKTALGDALRSKAGPWLRKMEDGFRESALSYLLVLRLVPLFPFFIVNLVPAFLGVRLRTYVIATFVGIIPGAFVFASVGAGLGSVFDAMEDFTLVGVLTPEIVTALVGLAALSLLPVVYKKLKAQRADA